MNGVPKEIVISERQISESLAESVGSIITVRWLPAAQGGCGEPGQSRAEWIALADQGLRDAGGLTACSATGW
jgi:hypothetical protein